jgi:hypothetical protein
VADVLQHWHYVVVLVVPLRGPAILQADASPDRTELIGCFGRASLG